MRVLGLDVMYVTEDTTRCDRRWEAFVFGGQSLRLRGQSSFAIRRVHVNADGAYALVTFVINEVVKPSGEKIRV